MILFDVKPFLRPFGKAYLLFITSQPNPNNCQSTELAAKWQVQTVLLTKTPLCPQNDYRFAIPRHTNQIIVNCNLTGNVIGQRNGGISWVWLLVYKLVHMVTWCIWCFRWRMENTVGERSSPPKVGYKWKWYAATVRLRPLTGNES